MFKPFQRAVFTSLCVFLTLFAAQHTSGKIVDDPRKVTVAGNAIETKVFLNEGESQGLREVLINKGTDLNGTRLNGQRNFEQGGWKDYQSEMERDFFRKIAREELHRRQRARIVLPELK